MPRGQSKGETKTETLLVDDNLAEVLQQAKDLVKEWEFETGVKVSSSPAIGPDGTVTLQALPLSFHYHINLVQGLSGCVLSHLGIGRIRLNGERLGHPV